MKTSTMEPSGFTCVPALIWPCPYGPHMGVLHVPMALIWPCPYGPHMGVLHVPMALIWVCSMSLWPSYGCAPCPYGPHMGVLHVPMAFVCVCMCVCVCVCAEHTLGLILLSNLNVYLLYRLEALLNGNVFSDPEMDMFEGFMREALACAQHTTSQEVRMFAPAPCTPT